MTSQRELISLSVCFGAHFLKSGAIRNKRLNFSGEFTDGTQTWIIGINKKFWDLIHSSCLVAWIQKLWNPTHALRMHMFTTLLAWILDDGWLVVANANSLFFISDTSVSVQRLKCSFQIGFLSKLVLTKIIVYILMLQFRQNRHYVWNMFKNSLKWKALIWTMQQTPDVLGFSLFHSLGLDGKSHLKLLKCCEWGRVLGSEGSAYCSPVTLHCRSDVAHVCLFCQGYIYLSSTNTSVSLFPVNNTCVYTETIFQFASPIRHRGGLKCLLRKQKQTKKKPDCKIKVFPVISKWAQGWKSMRDSCDSIWDS